MTGTVPSDPAPDATPTWRRVEAWALGYPSTVVLGVALTVLMATRDHWVAAGAIAFITGLMAPAERWADRRDPDGPGWTWFRSVHIAAVIVVTVVYVRFTAGEFYDITNAGLVFLPSATTIGRGLRSLRAPADSP